MHPTDPTLELKKIHFAAPFLGYLYVVAEFTNGDRFHYWLQVRAEWKSMTGHIEGDLIQPTTLNGLLYRAKRSGIKYELWSAGKTRVVNNVLEASTDNGFKFTVVQVTGAAPKSGTVEPAWKLVKDGITVEDTSLTQVISSTPVTGGGNNGESFGGGSTGGGLPPDVGDRYGDRFVFLEP